MYPSERSLVKKLEGKPFALLGINSDADKDALKKVMEKENITWRSWWDGQEGGSGPLSKAWNVRGWPTIYVLDSKGVIRFKNLRGYELDDAVGGLMKELEHGSKPAKQLKDLRGKELDDAVNGRLLKELEGEKKPEEQP